MSKFTQRNLKQGYIWAPRALVGENLTMQKNLLVKIKDNKIAAMEDTPPKEAKKYAASRPNFFRLEKETTLLPCLADAHIHLALDGKNYRTNGGKAQRTEEAREQIFKRLAQYRESGIGAVRDGGDHRGLNSQVKKLIEKQPPFTPQILSAGWALRRKESYGSFLGPGYSSSRRLKEELDRLFHLQADQIKVLLSGIVSFTRYGEVSGPPGMSLDELIYVTNRAHARGIKVMAHASSPEAIELALKAGVDSVEHGYFITGEQLKAMASQGISWISTLIPVAAQSTGQRENRENNDGINYVIEKILEEHMHKLGLALELGVSLGLGTDAGAPGVEHGVKLVEEMLLYQQAGLSRRAVLKAATFANAIIMGLDKSRGSLEVGRTPHLIAVRGDPLADLNALQKVTWSFLPGTD